MTLRELRDEIDALPDDCLDLEVRLAENATRPVGFQLAYAAYVPALYTGDQDWGGIYLVEGQVVGYMPPEIVRFVGWG